MYAFNIVVNLLIFYEFTNLIECSGLLLLFSINGILAGMFVALANSTNLGQ